MGAWNSAHYCSQSSEVNLFVTNSSSDGDLFLTFQVEYQGIVQQEEQYMTDHLVHRLGSICTILLIKDGLLFWDLASDNFFLFENIFWIINSGLTNHLWKFFWI